MNLKIFLTLFLVVSLHSLLYSQDDIQIGNQSSANYRYNGGVYDYSDPSAVNIKVQLWGYVRFPGYYIIPEKSSIHELISRAGGPTEDANLDDIRVTKIRQGSETVMFKYNYNDMVWEDKLESEIYYVPIEAGDVIVVPGEPRYFAREDFTFFFSIITSLATLAILIYGVTN
ncbi:MAG: SLBB domain-containing protein [Ignavibacteriaceae bacterium]|nr:SLBB domain-containing protein [Ignavibacteriaceae bacterium]